METRIDEISPDVFRVCTYLSKIDLQFVQFIVRDDEPLLYHTGLRGMFPWVRDAVARVVDPAKIRWIGFSHFESDECGSLNDWLATAPQAKPIASATGALVNINDFIGGNARILAHGEVLETGRRRFRFLETPHVPHSWDASLLFEETEGILFSSDLFLQNGDVAAVTEDDIVEAAGQSLLRYEAGPLAHPYPYSPLTEKILRMLAELRPKLIATMHGSSYRGDGERALRDLSVMMREVVLDHQ